jgi:hypothetical protein
VSASERTKAPAAGSAEHLPISVVIPAHNAASFISQTLDSVLAQTMKPAEIVVVDDDSADDTSGVVARYDVRVIRQRRTGVCGARNRGILAASQPWIALLDHDDVWAADKLARQWTAHQLCPEAGMIACDFAKFTDSGETSIASYLSLPEIKYGGLTKTSVAPGVDHLIRAAEEIYRVGWFLFPSVVLARRDLLIEAGLFDVALTLCEDVDCFLRVLSRTTLVVVRCPLVRWRAHPGNTSQDVLGLALARIGLAERMAANPHRYPTAAVTGLLGELSTIQAWAARMLLDVGRRREARILLGRSLKGAASLRTAALWGASWLNPTFFRLLVAGLRGARRCSRPLLL